MDISPWIPVIVAVVMSAGGWMINAYQFKKIKLEQKELDANVSAKFQDIARDAAADIATASEENRALRKELTAIRKDVAAMQLQIEALIAEKKILEDDKTQCMIRISQLETENCKLAARVELLENVLRAKNIDIPNGGHDER